ncbi:MAG: hypothetical protein EPO37_00030 [Nitrosarchaeum sp.]|nr:MAG: hypothetical protein EPO37_00030 [Nitrosarchaeum sp.]
MVKLPKNNISKVYCTRCDLIFDSRKTFEKHLIKHSSDVLCETCPIDTAISKFVNLFKRKSSHNLE